MKKVIVLLANGFEEMEAAICIDILRRAGLDVNIASVEDSKTVEGSRKMKIQADIFIKDLEELPDAIVLPGGMPGAENLASSDDVIKLVKDAYRANKLIAAICASPSIVLAPIGLLDGKVVTCYPGFEENLGDNIIYKDETVITDGNIITSKGPGTAFDFALEIVTYLIDAEKADLIKQRALIDTE